VVVQGLLPHGLHGDMTLTQSRLRPRHRRVLSQALASVTRYRHFPRPGRGREAGFPGVVGQFGCSTFVAVLSPQR
jgi:hypothetical protein